MVDAFANYHLITTKWEAWRTNCYAAIKLAKTKTCWFVLINNFFFLFKCHYYNNHQWQRLYTRRKGALFEQKWSAALFISYKLIIFVLPTSKWKACQLVDMRALHVRLDRRRWKAINSKAVVDKKWDVRALRLLVLNFHLERTCKMKNSSFIVNGPWYCELYAIQLPLVQRILCVFSCCPPWQQPWTENLPLIIRQLRKQQPSAGDIPVVVLSLLP